MLRHSSQNLLLWGHLLRHHPEPLQLRHALLLHNHSHRRLARIGPRGRRRDVSLGLSIHWHGVTVTIPGRNLCIRKLIAHLRRTSSLILLLMIHPLSLLRLLVILVLLPLYGIALLELILIPPYLLARKCALELTGNRRRRGHLELARHSISLRLVLLLSSILLVDLLLLIIRPLIRLPVTHRVLAAFLLPEMFSPSPPFASLYLRRFH